MVLPLDALGAAAAVAQFIECGVKLARESYDIYKSGNGVSRRTEKLAEQYTSLHELGNRIKRHLEGKMDIGTEAEKHLREVAEQCSVAADGLLKLLEDLKIDGPRSALKSTIVAIKAKWRHGKLLNHGEWLSQLQLRLQMCLQEVMSDRQSCIFRTLDSIANADREMEARLASKLNDMHKQLVDMNRRACAKKIPADGVGDLILALYTEARLVYPQQEVLSSLRFASINARQEDIKAAHNTTYDWIFQHGRSRSVRFTEWLSQSDGTYWITGKAGSGKSTLLKHICQHKTTWASLQEWAGTRELVVVSHYFWSIGTKMQRSKQGFLRSILFEILRKCPALMEQVCPARLKIDTSHEWVQSELDESIEVLVQQTLRHNGKDVCFCFFVDGLDEYDDRGSHDVEGTMQDFEDLIHIVQRLGSSDSIKVCASSRPWNVFSEAFEEATRAGNMLVLHEHTRPDIQRVVQDSLRPRLSARPTQLSSYQKLVDDIVDKAEGVFLWVVLVIRELLKSLRNADDITHVQRRLESMPPELDAFFDRIFNSIDPFYQAQTARIFHTTAAAVEPLPIIVLDIVESEDPERLATTENRWPSTDGALEQEMVERIVKQVNGRCLDLLEIRKPSGLPSISRTTRGSFSTFFHTIEFMHRTVREYLRTPKMTAKLSAMAGSGFRVETTLCALYLSILKHKPSTIRVHGRFQIRDNEVEVWTRDIWRHAFHEMLKSARVIEERQCISPLQLLEDLEITRDRRAGYGSKYWAIRREDGSLNTDATSKIDDYFHRRQDLLLLFIMSGLTLSVQQYLDHLSQVTPVRLSMFLEIALSHNDLHGIDYQIVSLLLNRGADPNHINDRGSRPLDHFLSIIATMMNSGLDSLVPEVRVLEALLRHGAYATTDYWKCSSAAESPGHCTNWEVLKEVYGAEVAEKLSATMLSNASAASPFFTSAASPFFILSKSPITKQEAKSRPLTWRSLFKLS